ASQTSRIRAIKGPVNAGARLISLLFFDPGTNTSTNEYTVAVGSTLAPKLRGIDSTGAVRSDLTVTYSSSNEEVAKVDTSSGVITGLKAGASTIRASAGGLVAAVTVTVIHLVPGGDFSVTGVAVDVSRLLVVSSEEHVILSFQSLDDPPSVVA